MTDADLVRELRAELARRDAELLGVRSLEGTHVTAADLRARIEALSDADVRAAAADEADARWWRWAGGDLFRALAREVVKLRGELLAVRRLALPHPENVFSGCPGCGCDMEATDAAVELALAKKDKMLLAAGDRILAQAELLGKRAERRPDLFPVEV